MIVNKCSEKVDIIGIYMDKSTEMFISILAILKAGGAFVPLDPEHPIHRIRTILGLTESKVVLVTRELQHRLDSALLDTGIVSLLVDVTQLSPAPKPNVGLVGRDDVSHILFTSGSTGIPKGVKLQTFADKRILIPLQVLCLRMGLPSRV
jgi:non-ribosomal peptide synthetase component F